MAGNANDPFAEIAQHIPLLLHPKEGTRRSAEALECMSDVDLIEPDIGPTRPMYLDNRNRVLAALNAQQGDLIVMTGDKLEMRTGSDTEILFRQASSVWYLANMDRYDTSLAIDPVSGWTTLLVKEQTERENTFNGNLPSFEDLAIMHDVDDSMYSKDFASMLANYPGTIYTVDVEELYAQFPFITNGADSTSLVTALNTARAVKNQYELEMLRHSSQVAADAHLKAWAATTLEEPLNTEFVVENAFLSACYSCGLRFQAYIPIIASGPNSATLHYNANDRFFVDGELMLIDAAPETKGYTSDVSRTYPVNGKFTPDQKLVYDIVLGTQKAGIEAFVPGRTWGEVNLVTQEYMTTGLLNAGFVQGELEELLAAKVYSTFMPHGLGHSVGLDVHDIPFSGVAVQGNVYTIEPGIYFVDDLLNAALEGPTANLYNKEMIDRFRGFGGIRIEDVIAVTEDGNECLSCSTPKETEEIEAIFASFAKPGGSVSGESSDDSLSSGAVVGLVAAAAVVGAVAVGAFFMMRGSKQKATGDLNQKLVTDNEV